MVDLIKYDSYTKQMNSGSSFFHKRASHNSMQKKQSLKYYINFQPANDERP